MVFSVIVVRIVVGYVTLHTQDLVQMEVLDGLHPFALHSMLGDFVLVLVPKLGIEWYDAFLKFALTMEVVLLIDTVEG